jgi:hypothetical protein
LLVPSWALAEHLNRTPKFDGWDNVLTAGGVLNAAAIFDVSVEVMAKRIFFDLHLAPHRVAII